VTTAVDPGRILVDLERLVRIPSVTGSEEVIQSEMERLLEELGLATRRIETDPIALARDPDFPGAEMPRSSLPVVIGRIGPTGGRRILLVGHVDVVPIGDPAHWTVDPWGATRRDGRLYGRGACDMKGGLAAILGAVRAVIGADGRSRRQRGGDLRAELVVISVPSEEDGGQGMLAAIRGIAPTADGATGDAAVITEPTGLDVVIAHAGAITFRLDVPGRAAHASVRREGVSALDNLSYLVRALDADERRRNAAETDPLMTAIGLPYPTIVGTVAGGDWPSTVMDRVIAEGRYGVRLGQTWREAEVELREAIDAACDDDPFLRDHRPTLEISGGRFSSARMPGDHPLPVGLANAAEAALGRRPAMIGVPYGADMRLLVNEGRTPTVIYGPGDIRVAHAADEWTPLDQVVDCARTLATWLERELLPA